MDMLAGRARGARRRAEARTAGRAAMVARRRKAIGESGDWYGEVVTTLDKMFGGVKIDGVPSMWFRRWSDWLRNGLALPGKSREVIAGGE